MKIKKTQFRGCCGIQVLFDFGNTNETTGSKDSLSKSEIMIDLKKYLIEGFIPDYYPHECFPLPVIKKGITLIAFNDEQNKKLRKTILKMGFIEVAKGWNNQHKNYNHLYAYTLDKKDYK